MCKHRASGIWRNAVAFELERGKDNPSVSFVDSSLCEGSGRTDNPSASYADSSAQGTSFGRLYTRAHGRYRASAVYALQNRRAESACPTVRWARAHVQPALRPHSATVFLCAKKHKSWHQFPAILS